MYRIKKNIKKKYKKNIVFVLFNDLYIDEPNKFYKKTILLIFVHVNHCSCRLTGYIIL